jgi:hypothetical protein
LDKQRQDILQIANDSDVDPQTRLDAHNLAMNIDWAVLKLDYEAPSILSRYLKLDISNFVQDQTGLNLTIRSIDDNNEALSTL